MGRTGKNKPGAASKPRIAVLRPCDLARAGLVGACAGEFEVVLVAGTGGELLSALHKGLEVDVVLLELDLPLMDGFAVLARLRERYAGLRVLVMAHKPPDEEVRRAMRQGAGTVLCTGMDPAWLPKALNDVLLTGHHMSPLLRRLLETGWHLGKEREQQVERTRDKKKPSPNERRYWEEFCRMKNASIRAVGERIGATYHSARTYHRRLCAKLGVRGCAGLLLAGMKEGLVPEE